MKQLDTSSQMARPSASVSYRSIASGCRGGRTVPDDAPECRVLRLGVQVGERPSTVSRPALAEGFIGRHHAAFRQTHAVGGVFHTRRKRSSLAASAEVA